jgi:hypothetical protein
MQEQVTVLDRTRLAVTAVECSIASRIHTVAAPAVTTEARMVTFSLCELSKRDSHRKAAAYVLTR